MNDNKNIIYNNSSLAFDYTKEDNSNLISLEDIIWLFLQVAIPVIRFIVIPLVIIFKDWIYNHGSEALFIAVLAIGALLCLYFGTKAFIELISVFE